MRTAVLILLSTFGLQAKLSLKQVREAYFRAATSKDESSRLSHLLDTVGEKSDPVILCYKGAAEMLKAKYAVNPFAKMSWFNKGRDLIERSILRDTSCVESRFVRFTIQRNLPGFLGYDQNIRKDSSMIAERLQSMADTDLRSRIGHYFTRLSAGIKN
ncbi:MAG: hypothetical protein JST50_13035 [Bacteroidetes bacterium]|jgi:hypothetical protein|nr:hypothetical protein [Bacteroidota bacterium]